MSAEQTAELQALAAAEDEPGVPVAFIPYVPGEGVPSLVSEDTIILGGRACNDPENLCPLADGTIVSGDEFFIFSGDTLEVRGTFNPGPVEAEVEYTLSFLALDQLAYVETYRMDAVVEVNGEEVGRYAMVDASEDQEGYSIFEMQVTGLVADSANDLRVFIDTSGPNITRYQDRIVYLWDARLAAADGTERSLDLEDLVGNVERGPDRLRYITDGLHATTNADWRVGQHFDGLMVKYASREYAYDPEVHARFIESTCAPFLEAGKPCIEVLWGNDQWTGDVVGTPTTPSAVPYLQAAQDFASGILVWMQPLNIFDRSLGTFAERWPTTDGYQVAAGFPGQSVPIPGAYHSWTLFAPATTTYTLRLNEHGNMGSAKLNHIVEVDGEVVLQLESVDPSVLDENERTVDFDANEGQQVTIRQVLVGGYGYGPYLSEYDLVDRDGASVDLSSALHESGVSADTEFMWTCFTAYFSTHDFWAACGL